MRSEEEILNLVLSFARADSRVRAVCMNGSRANPAAPADCFRDFDIVFLVTDIAPFLEDKSWINGFGERMIMQTPEEPGGLFSPSLGGRYTFLMQFTDGNRIDLMLCPLTMLNDYVKEDSQIVALLDKDGLLPPLAAPSDETYRIKRPSARCFADCCNEFFWVSVYVAKGLWRRELPYALHHLDECVRPMLLNMLTWQAGVLTGFCKSAGKCGKYLNKYLPPPVYEAYLATYTDAAPGHVWAALFRCIYLFRQSAGEVAAALGFSYPEKDDAAVSAYLLHIKNLAPGAKEIF